MAGEAAIADGSGRVISGTQVRTLGVSDTTTRSAASNSNPVVSLSAYNAGGASFNESASYDAAALPASTRFNWIWPDSPIQGVYAFNSVQYGSYFYNAPSLGLPFLPIKTIQILELSHDVAISGRSDEMNVIYDFFLTDRPLAIGNGGGKVYEVEICLNNTPSGLDYANRNSSAGVYADEEGRAWSVSVDYRGKDILFMRRDVTQTFVAAVDVKLMLNWLVRKNVLNGNEYFGGLALGAEPVMGKGALTINSLSVVYR